MNEEYIFIKELNRLMEDAKEIYGCALPEFDMVEGHMDWDDIEERTGYDLWKWYIENQKKAFRYWFMSLHIIERGWRDFKKDYYQHREAFDAFSKKNQKEIGKQNGKRNIKQTNQ